MRGCTPARGTPRHGTEDFTAFPPRTRSSYQVFRQDPDDAIPEQRAFWRWATSPNLGRDGIAALELLPQEEQRVLSKASSGGGFLVPSDVSEMVTAAARAASSVAQVAQES
jgi:hypothetical protein